MRALLHEFPHARQLALHEDTAATLEEVGEMMERDFPLVSFHPVLYPVADTIVDGTALEPVAADLFRRRRQHRKHGSKR